MCFNILLLQQCNVLVIKTKESNTSSTVTVCVSVFFLLLSDIILATKERKP